MVETLMLKLGAENEIFFLMLRGRADIHNIRTQHKKNRTIHSRKKSDAKSQRPSPLFFLTRGKILSICISLIIRANSAT